METYVAGQTILKSILYYDGLDKKGVRNIQQDINILLKNNDENNSLEQKFSKYIIAVSIVIPLVVNTFGIKLKDFGYDVAPSFLPQYMPLPME
jgi:hypothetical protein